MKTFNKKNFLVIGGTGYIGFHLLKKAKKFNWNLTSISRRAPSKLRILKGVKYLKLNIFSRKDVEKKITKNYDYIVNLAGESGGSFNRIRNTNFYNREFYKFQKVVEFFSKKRVKRFIQVGSSSEYGSAPVPHNEDDNCLPLSNYGKSKLKSTNYFLKICKKKNFPGTLIRLFQVYGKNQSIDKIIPFLIKNCKENRKFKLTSGHQTRDFCYIEDVTDAIFRLFIKSKKINGEIFNIASGRCISIKKLTKLIQKKIKGGRPVLGALKVKKYDIKKSHASVKKIKKIVKWSPKFNLNKGLDLLIKE